MYHDHLGRFSGANGVRGALQACTRVRDLRMCCFFGCQHVSRINGDVWFKYNVGKAITNHPYWIVYGFNFTTYVKIGDAFLLFYKLSV